MADHKKSKSKEDREVEDRVHVGSKDPADRDFAEWITKQWRRGEQLEKIDIIPITKGKTFRYGDTIDFEVFTSAHPVDMDEATNLSNRLYGSAQRMVNRIFKKRTNFLVRAFDRGRKSTEEAVDTFPLDLAPTKDYQADDSSDEESDTTITGAHAATLEYLRLGVSAIQRDRDRDDSNLGDLIQMFMLERRESRAYEAQLHREKRELMADWVAAIRERESALSQQEDRELRRQVTQLKIDGLREGAKFGKNILTGLLGGGLGLGASASGGGGSSTKLLPGTVHKQTKEQVILTTFLEDIRKDKKLEALLFGKFEEVDGGARLVEKGIFNVDQFAILVNTQRGISPADELDDLLPSMMTGDAPKIGKISGEPLPVSPEQLERAQEALPGSLAILLRQIVEHRLGVRAARATQASAPAETAPTTDTSTNTADSQGIAFEEVKHKPYAPPPLQTSESAPGDVGIDDLL